MHATPAPSSSAPNPSAPSLPAADRHAVHVIGGGLAGLTAAAFVARAGRPVVVHEQRHRLGGRASTDERQGYRFNQGPHALYVGGAARSVLDELGVRPTGPTPRTRGAMMMRGGALHLAPSGVGSLATTRLLGGADKLELGRIMAGVASFDPAPVAGITVREWVDRIAGRARVRDVLHALIRLTSYVNAPDTMSAEIAVQQIQLGMSTGVIYVDHGWESIVAGLVDVVERSGGIIQSGRPVTELPEAAAVIIATGGPEVAARLTGETFVHGPAAQASTLDLALTELPSHRVVIGIDEPIYLSDHGAPAGLVPDGRASVSLAHYLPMDAATDADPDRAGLRAFARRAGVSDDLVVDERYLHRMTTVSAVATAALGGLRGRPPVAVPGRPGVFLAGDWVGPVGHLADASLASAREAARLAVVAAERSVAA